MSITLQARLIFPDFTISVCGSSCNLVFCSHSLSFDFCFFASHLVLGCQYKIAGESKGTKGRQKKTYLHELPCTEMVRNIVRLASDRLKCTLSMHVQHRRRKRQKRMQRSWNAIHLAARMI